MHWPYVTQGMPYGSQFWRHWQTYANSAGHNTVVHKRQKVMFVALAHPVDSMPATYEVRIFVAMISEVRLFVYQQLLCIVHFFLYLSLSKLSSKMSSELTVVLKTVSKIGCAKVFSKSVHKFVVKVVSKIVQKNCPYNCSQNCSQNCSKNCPKN